MRPVGMGGILETQASYNSNTVQSCPYTMKPWFKHILIVALATSVYKTWALDAQQTFERVSPSVVVIKAGDSQGSGVIYAVDTKGLTPSSTILTNCHVVKGHSQVTVERLGKKATGFVKVCDADRDMAVITLGGALPTLPARTTPLKVGEPAFAVGSPQGLELSISQGIVSQLRATQLGKDPMIQTTAAISKGSSGGGLFDSEARLIGLTTLYHKDGQSLNFAVPISFVGMLKNTSAHNQIAGQKPTINDSRQKKCGWAFQGVAEVDGSNDYVDHCKISGTGRYRFLWTMNDYKKPQQDVGGRYFYSSVATKWVFDCQLLRSAVTAIYYYQGKMTQGSVLDSFSVSENEWDFLDFPPDSIGTFKTEAVCK